MEPMGCALAGVRSPLQSTSPSTVASTPHRALSDEDLLRACATGDRDALRELTRRHQTPIYRFLLRMMGSPEDAEEASIDVFVRAWQHAPRFQFRAKVATWLYRIAVNIARDAHSRKKGRVQQPWPEAEELERMSIGSAEDDAVRKLELDRQTRRLHAALARLNPNDRLVIVLYYLEDREYEDIQRIAGVSYTVLKTRLARARRRLRALMEADGSEVES